MSFCTSPTLEGAAVDQYNSYVIPTAFHSAEGRIWILSQHSSQTNMGHPIVFQQSRLTASNFILDLSRGMHCLLHCHSFRMILIRGFYLPLNNSTYLPRLQWWARLLYKRSNSSSFLKCIHKPAKDTFHAISFTCLSHASSQNLYDLCCPWSGEYSNFGIIRSKGSKSQSCPRRSVGKRQARHYRMSHGGL